MDYAAIAYSLVVTAGGVMGYVKKGSIVSGLMGLACGGLIGKISTDAKANIWLVLGDGRFSQQFLQVSWA